MHTKSDSAMTSLAASSPPQSLDEHPHTPTTTPTGFPSADPPLAQPLCTPTTTTTTATLAPLSKTSAIPPPPLGVRSTTTISTPTITTAPPPQIALSQTTTTMTETAASAEAPYRFAATWPGSPWDPFSSSPSFPSAGGAPTSPTSPRSSSRAWCSIATISKRERTPRGCPPRCFPSTRRSTQSCHVL
ncbi:hypothetical protein OPV22_001721 [Ensete ventricosum]|uniref:Uncharacterized protein n=1 Tax=Ensete ventricosum TaxID=4639 RepID=A0AAV8RQR6_ENSVE|nr:hypothetical protein OPV22_001721 [Ensete ventricosum]